VAAHIQAFGEDGQLANWQQVSQEIRNQPDVLATAPFVEGQALLSYSGEFRGALVRGIVPELEDKVAGLGRHMMEGTKLTNLRAGEFGIVLGRELARSLNAHVGDKLALMTPQGNQSPAGMIPRVRSFVVVGIVFVDMYQYDANLALINIEDAQKLYRMGDNVSGVRLKITDPLTAPELATRLQASTKLPIVFRDWTMEDAAYFRAVEIEKRMMFLILTLIVVIASANIVTNLVMAVTEKQADIAILRTLGASPRSILTIFVIQGAASGIVGTIIGVIGGVALASHVGKIVHFFENLFGSQILSPQVYLVSELPSDVQLGDVLSIGLVALAMSLLATLYPSWRASRINPAEALRYE
jgi:lipoprotein-releasing system permease protein